MARDAEVDKQQESCRHAVLEGWNVPTFQGFLLPTVVDGVGPVPRRPHVGNDIGKAFSQFVPQDFLGGRYNLILLLTGRR